MKITRSNYESYFLDYHEGNLNDGLKNDLFLFLESNPDLKEEFESFEIVVIPSLAGKFFDKDSLKKNTVTIYNYKTWFIGYIEDDLIPSEREEVRLFLEKNPSLKPELEIFRQTKLVPDYRIVFENKKQLKHGGKVIRFTPQVYRLTVAATIALLFIAYFFIRNNRELMIAHREPMKPKIQQPVIFTEPSTSHVNSNTEPVNQNKSVDRNKPERKNRGVQKQEPILKQVIPVPDLNTNDPLLSQQSKNVNPVFSTGNLSSEKKDSSSQLFAENKVNSPGAFKPTTSQLSEVFSNDDLRELGVEDPSQQRKKSGLFDLAVKGADELNKATGANIAMNNRYNELENTNSFALAIGNFSFSHTSAK